MVVDPLVSVLMTAYNRDRYIAEAIESVLNQGYSNFELIIVDDCSTDTTPDIARSFQLKDSRIRFYINDRNLGDYHNRNKAASFAKGVYLKYLDADDVLFPNGLSQMVKAIESFPAAAFGLQCPSTLLHFQLPQILYPKDSLNKHYFNGGVFLSGPSGSIIRKDIFDKIGGFTGKRFIGDSELWLTMGMEYPVVLFPPNLIWWREHDEQEYRHEKKSFDPVIQRFFLDLKIISDPAFPLDKAVVQLLIKKTNRRFLMNIFKFFFKSGKIKSSFLYLRQSKMTFAEVLKAVFH